MKKEKISIFRRELIGNVLSYHRHFKETIHLMTNVFLEAHVHPLFREYLMRKYSGNLPF